MIDNCQHILLRCCVNLMDLYGRLGVSGQVAFHREFYFIEPGGRVSTFRAGFLPAPLHFTGSFLAMGCLYVLRLREPELFRNYRAPLNRMLPITVVLLSAFAVYVYGGIDVKVIPLTALLYAVGLSYYWFWAHGRIQTAAPEEIAARQAGRGNREQGTGDRE